MSLLAAENLSVRRGPRTVVAGVSLHLAAGEVVGLIGANGSGKSTCLSALAGLLPPAGGGVTLTGQPLTGLPPEARARQLGYLPQNPECHWPLSVRQVVTLGRLPYRSPWGGLGAADAAAVAAALHRLELEPLAERTLTRLSGGERMRVMLARVLAGEPRVLLADEPTDGLDPHHQLQVMELLRTLAAEGRGVLTVLHDLSLAERFCDRLLLLHEGRIIAAGPAEQVLTPENCARAYRIETVRFDQAGRRVTVPWRRLPD